MSKLDEYTMQNEKELGNEKEYMTLRTTLNAERIEIHLESDAYQRMQQLVSDPKVVLREVFYSLENLNEKVYWSEADIIAIESIILECSDTRLNTWKTNDMVKTCCKWMEDWKMKMSKVTPTANKALEALKTLLTEVATKNKEEMENIIYEVVSASDSTQTDTCLKLLATFQNLEFDLITSSSHIIERQMYGIYTDVSKNRPPTWFKTSFAKRMSYLTNKIKAELDYK